MKNQHNDIPRKLLERPYYKWPKVNKRKILVLADKKTIYAFQVWNYYN